MAIKVCLEPTPTINGLRFILLIIFVLLFAIATVGGCSDDETTVEPENGDGTADDGTAVRLASWNALTGEGAVRSTPAGVAAVRFTITSPEIQTIEKTVQVSQQIVEETFEIPEARVVRFDVQALDGSAQLIYRGVYYGEVNRGTDLVYISMISSSDADAPSFTGLTAAEAWSDTDANLSWDAADDVGAPPSDIVYLVYLATTPGAQDYAFPDYATKPGNAHATMSELDPGTTYYTVVRAMDPAGNVDSNTEEQSLTTFSAGDIVYVDVDTGEDTPDCGSLQNPCKSITHAVVKSSDNLTLRVAKGTYSRSTGEVFPIQLKPGMDLIGEGEWVPGPKYLHTLTFAPRTIIDADTLPVTQAADNTTLVAFYFDSNSDDVWEPVIDGQDDDRLTVFRCSLDGRDNPQASGIWMGGHYSRIEETRIFGFSENPGRAIYTWGDDIIITRNRIEDNFSGVSFQGDNNWISHNHITGHAAGALSTGMSVNPVILRNYIADNGGTAISLNAVTRAEIIDNVIHNNGQEGIWLGGDDMPDSAYVILNTIVNNTGIGLFIKTNDADVYNNHFACNRLGIFIESPVEIDARWNSWENDPPTVSANVDPGYSICLGTWDICYSAQYAGVPEPLYLPSSGKGGCAIYDIPPLSPPRDR